MPKWCGERPGKKEGDPNTPDEEETKEEDVGEIDDIMEDEDENKNEEDQGEIGRAHV